MCTLQELHVEHPREVEMISVSHRSLQSFKSQVEELIRGAQRLTWVLREASCRKVDQDIAELLAPLPAHTRDRLELWLFVYQWDQAAPMFAFPKTCQLMPDKQIKILTLPLRELYEQSQAEIFAESSSAWRHHLAALSPFDDSFSA